MAGYNYSYRGYTTYDDHNWSKPSYASDHVCKPVIIDAEGRKHPIVSYNPNCNTGPSIIETQTIVQQVHSPFMSDYKHSSPTRYEVEPLKDYGDGEAKWRNPSNPVHFHHDRDRPQKVEEFLTKMQTEVSRPNRFSPLSASHWRKPSGNTILDESYDDNYWSKGHGTTGTQPTKVTNGGWARPSPAGWGSLPDTSLSRPTNDIGTAVEYLKEAIKPGPFTPSPHSRVTVPISTGPKRDDYAENFDSREAARRYGNFNSSSHPHPVDTYASTIDSREAAKRYGNFNSSSQPVDMYAPTIDSREALRKYGGKAI